MSARRFWPLPRRRPSGIPAWWAGYERRWLRGDLIAGVTVTAYLIPQVMAYAEVAGVPAVTGLWAVTGAVVVYAFLGSSRLLSVGPESTTALMTAAALGAAAGPGRHAELAVALCLVVAVVCLVGRLVGLAKLSELLSRPVLIGYMAGVAGVMVVSQFDKLTGLEIQGDGVLPETWFLLRHLSEVHPPTLALGLATAALMIAAAHRWPRAPVALVGMLAATAVVAATDLAGRGVEVVGPVPRGLPVPALPSVSWAEFGALLVPALGVSLVAYSDNILTARAFAGPGEHIDPRRELVALGAANVGAAVMQGFPVSSSGSRTAIAAAVGGRTQLAGLVAVAATVLASFGLGRLLAAFPTAALGAVVVYAATRLVEVPEFRRFLRFRRSEFLIALGTTLAVLLLGVLEGVLVAVVLSVADLLRRVAQPHDAVLGIVPGLAGMHDVDDYPQAELLPGLVVYRYDSPLFFANAEDFRVRALAACEDFPGRVRWFVLNVEAIVAVDITAADALEQLRSALAERGVVFALARLKQDLRDELAPTGLLERIGEDRLFPTLPTAVAAYQAWRDGTEPEP